MLLWIAASTPAVAQVPDLSVDGLPAELLIGEQVCITANFTNAQSPTGYGPYIISIADEGVRGVSIDFADIQPVLDFIGVFGADGVLTDPVSGQPVNGPEGGSAYAARYPVGSLDPGNPPLPMEICIEVGVNAQIGVPLEIDLIPGFEYGNTPTGDNGAILGTGFSSTVTPIAARVEKDNTAPENERPPGPDWVFSYTYELDISQLVTIENLLLSDSLPGNIQWTGSNIGINAPLGVGCSVLTPPNLAPVPGGELEIACSSVTGTSSEADLSVSVPVYITDTLDETIDDSQAIQNTVTAQYDFEDATLTDSDDSDVLAVHAAVQKSVQGEPLPGENLTYSIDFQLTDFPAAPDAGADMFTIVDVIPDGMAFDNTLALTVNGAPVAITESVIPGPGGGESTVTWDVANALGGTLPTGSGGTLSYAVTILNSYDSGAPVQAADTLTNSVDLTYTLTEGGNGGNGSSAPVEITRNEPDKRVQAPDPLPAELMPGEVVTFRLAMTIPAGSTSNIVFRDYLPRPVFDVADFDTSNDFTLLPPYESLAPTVSSNTVDNSVTFEFGDIVQSEPTVLALDLRAAITSEPFADNLFLTNLLASAYDNSDGDTVRGLDAAGITVGAPDLVITKGVFAVDNPRAVIQPAPPASPAQDTVDGDATGVDAFDNVTYVITVENIGGQPAYNVTIDDAAVAGLNCAAPTVENGDGDPIAIASGTLQGGLVLDGFLESNDGNPGAPYGADTALVTVVCNPGASVVPGQEITNGAGVTWTSTETAAGFFDRRTDDATITMDVPQLEKRVTTITPGYAGTLDEAHIGEIVTYELQVTVPEGTSPQVRLEDVLDLGMAFVDVLSVTASSVDVATSEGNFNDVLGNAGILAQGATPEGPDRKLVFGPGDNANGFGDLANSNANNGVAETINIVYRARVLNTALNSADANTKLQNRAQWEWLDSTGNRQSIQERTTPVSVVEPALRVDKTFTPDVGDNTTPPRVRLEISHNGASSADAYDVSIIDALPAEVVVDGPIDTSGCAAPAPDSVRVDPGVISDEVTASWSSFPRGSTCVLEFDTDFPVPIPAGVSVQNCAKLDWQSLAMTDQPLPGPPNNTIGVERTGDTNDPGGQANTYSIDGCDIFTVFSVGILKKVSATSQPQTDGAASNPDWEALTIGEQVTFELTVTLPESPALRMQVIDILPTVNAKLELLGASTTFVGDLLDPADPDPTPAISDSDGDGINDTVGLDYGIVQHDLSDPATNDRDRIRIEVIAKVLDNTANINTQVDDNDAIVRFGRGLNASDNVTIELVEPLLDVDKSSDSSAVEAGDIISYRLTVLHTPASRIDASDVELSEVLPPKLQLVSGSAVVGPRCDIPPSAGPLESGGNTVSATWDAFPLGAICEIDFQATVDVSAVSGEEIVNEARLAWTSLDTNGDADDREYGASSEWPVVVSVPGLTKTLTDTSIEDSRFGFAGASPELTIGETVTFTIDASFPDGTTRDVTVSDLLPSGTVALQFVDTEIISVGGDLVIDSNPQAGDSAQVCAGGDPACRQWVFGNVVNTPDQRPEPDSEDSVVLSVTAIVLDDPQNSGLPGVDKDLENTARLESPDADLTDIAIFSLVEPSLEISKLTGNGTFEDTTVAGQVHRFTLRLRHTANSTATAYAVQIEDALHPEAEWVDDANVTSDCPGFTIAASPPSGSSGDVVFMLDQLALDTGDCVIEYDIMMSNTLSIPGTFENTATLAWESAPGSPDSRPGADSATALLVSYVDAAIIKQVVATSVPATDNGRGDPALPDVTIGEIVEYLIISKFTEGTTDNVTLTDIFQEDASGSLELIGGAPVAVGANISTTLPGDPVVNGNVITVDYGTVTNLADGVLDKDDTITYSLQLRVVDDPRNTGGDTLVNDVEQDYQVGAALETVVDTASVDVVEPVLDMSKTFVDVDAAVATIRIELTNTGSAPAYDLSVTDDFDESLWLPLSMVPILQPPGFSLTQSSAGGITKVDFGIDNPGPAPKPNQVLLPGDSLTFEFTMTLQNDGVVGVGRIDNTAEGEASSLPGADDNERVTRDSATDSLLLPVYDLEKTWSGPNNPARPGDTLTYTLRLENTGEGAASNVVIVDDPDDIGEFQAGSVQAADGVVDVGNNPADTTVQVTFASLPAGATASVSYNVAVPLPYVDGMTASQSLRNQATAISDELPLISSDDPDTAAQDDPTVVPIDADPVMRVNKDDQVLFASAGDTIVYAIGYTNIGDQDATGVLISESVPPSTVFDSAASTPGWSCADGAAPGTTCTYTLGTVDGLSGGTLMFAVRIDDSLEPGVRFIENSVLIEEDGVEFDSDPPPGPPSTDSDDERTPLEATPNLVIFKNDGDISVVPGQFYNYGIVYTNNGTQDATGVVITETVPSDTFFSAAQSVGNWSCANGSLPGTECTLDIGLLRAGFGGGARFGLQVIEPALAGVELISNRVTIEDDGSNSLAPLFDDAEDTTPLIAAPDMVIDKSADTSRPKVGRVIVFTLEYSNTGNQDATGVEITEVVPEGAEFAAAESAPSAWSCSDGAPAGTACTLAVGDLASGASGTAFFAVTVSNEPSSGAIVNTVVIRDDGTNGSEPTPENNIDRVSLSFFVAIPALGPVQLALLALAILALGSRGLRQYNTSSRP